MSYKSLFRKLNKWPLGLFRSLSVVLKIIVGLIFILTILAPDPIDFIALGFWGIVGTIISKHAVVGWILVAIGFVIWAFVQAVEATIVTMIALYLIPAFVGSFIIAFGENPNTFLFGQPRDQS